MYSDDDYDGDDESTFKIKKECEAMIENIYDKMNNINEVFNIIIKINDELKKSIKLIYEIMRNLSDDLQSTQAEINTINAKIDDASNFACNKIYKKNRKNRISSKEINIDNLNLLKIMISLTDDIISELKSKILALYKYTYKLYEKDVDKIHLTNSEIKEFMIQLKQDLREIFDAEDLLRQYSENTNKTIVS